MESARLLRVPGRLALASILVGTSLTFGAGLRAAAAAPGDNDRDDPPWPARVANTLGRGLIVRSGPSQDYPAMATLQEGTRLQVVNGPEVDRDGRSWYMVGSWDRSGRTGWSSGDYLVQIDPNDPDPTPATGVQSSSAGRTFVARVTAYSYQSPAGGAHGSITRTGTQAHWGTVAVDPSVIPLGSRLLIEGFDNVFVAEDTGGGVRGNHIDIFFPDYTSAVRFGVQNRSVTVLSP